MLAIVYAIEHYHLYLYGAPFTVITDHKPLLGIVNSTKPATARIERWRLRLMPYEMKLLYVPGRDDLNPVDYISRHPQTPPRRDNLGERYISYVTTSAIPKTLSIDEVKKATSAASRKSCQPFKLTNGMTRQFPTMHPFETNCQLTTDWFLEATA